MVSRDGILGRHGQLIWYTRWTRSVEMVYWNAMVSRGGILSIGVIEWITLNSDVILRYGQ